MSSQNIKPFCRKNIDKTNTWITKSGPRRITLLCRYLIPANLWDNDFPINQNWPDMTKATGLFQKSLLPESVMTAAQAAASSFTPAENSNLSDPAVT